MQYEDPHATAHQSNPAANTPAAPGWVCWAAFDGGCQSPVGDAAENSENPTVTNAAVQAAPAWTYVTAANTKMTANTSRCRSIDNRESDISD